MSLPAGCAPSGTSGRKTGSLLRVYDSAGRSDETVAALINRRRGLMARWKLHK